ncbi:putative reverse transcriptase domain-containing protein [Tanacetum coccineum]
MSMTIQSGVKNKILNTSSETPKVENAPAEMLCGIDQQMEKGADDGKANVVTGALSRKERVKPRHVRAMTMTIQYGVRGMILVAQRGVRTIIMDEAYKSRYSVHPGADKMYYDLRDMYWWPRMKRDIATYVSECLTCAKLPRTRSGHDAIWVVVDRLTKSAHFLAIHEDYSTEKLARLYTDEIVAHHGVPVSIILDRDARSPMLWAEIREGSLIGPELVQEMTDKVVVIKEKLSATRDCQKSYADSGRKMTEYEVGDNGLLKVSPGKGVMRFGKKGKLAPRYIRPFEILERIGLVAYRLRLPEELIGVHDTFHVSNLKKCLGNANLHVPLNEIKIDKTLRFVEEPIEIMDRKVKSLKRNRIPLVKVHWNSKCGPEFTWEREDYMKSKYPQLFVDRAVEPTTCVDIVWKLLVHQGGLPAGIYGLFSGWYCGLASMKVTLGVSIAWAKGVTTGTLVRYEMSCGRLLGNLFEDKEVGRSG